MIKEGHVMNRRGFLNTTSAALVASLMTNPLFAQNFITDLELGNRKDIYALHGVPGKWRPVEVPVLINFDNRSLQTWIYCSPNVDRAKLIVFSHDLLVEPQIYMPLFEFLTSHGYCIVAPIHEDSFLNEGLNAQENDVMGNSSWNFNSILDNKEIWLKRVNDCNKSLEKVNEIANTIKTAIDRSSPVIMGHGLGAFITQLALGAKVQTSEDANEEAVSEIFLENKNWSAGILLSPYGSGVLGLTTASWANINAPFLIITGEEDKDLSQQTSEQKSEMYFGSPGYYRHLGILSKGDHTIFSGQRAIPRTKENDIFKDIKVAINLFLSAYSQYDQVAFTSLYNPSTFDVFGYKYLKMISK